VQDGNHQSGTSRKLSPLYSNAPLLLDESSEQQDYEQVTLSHHLPLQHLLTHLPSTRHPLAFHILSLFGAESQEDTHYDDEIFVDYLGLAVWMNRFNGHGGLTGTTTSAQGGTNALAQQDSSSGLHSSEGSPVFSPSPLLKASSIAQMQQNTMRNSSMGSGESSLQKNSPQEQRYRFLFRLYDQNNDGFLDHNDLARLFRAILSSEMNEMQIELMAQKTVRENDRDRDGKLKYGEFRAVLEGYLG